MSLAQRVRDFRYSKGWGPDELANRAEISRTALYQIESGKTGLPRAGTLRRIAVALEVPMEDLLGHEDDLDDTPQEAAERVSFTAPVDGPLRLGALGGGAAGDAVARQFPRVIAGGCRRFAVQRRIGLPAKTNGHDSIYLREGELMSKLHDLLHSPIGESVARIVDELHVTLPRSRPSI